MFDHQHQHEYGCLYC